MCCIQDGKSLICLSPLLVAALPLEIALVSLTATVALLFFLAKSAWIGYKSLSDPSLSSRATLIGAGHLALISIPVVGIITFFILVGCHVKGFKEGPVMGWVNPFFSFLQDSFCCCYTNTIN